MGLGAGALAAAGGVMWWRGDEGGGGILLRSALVLAALWLAWPSLAAIDRRWLTPAVAAFGLAVVRPALLIWLVPVLLAVGLTRRRSR